MSEVLIKVENVSKKFCKDLKRSLWYGMTDIARSVMGGAPAENLREGEFWAVRDVSFEVRRGECLGLIGHNGAGKSTLLKMLNGLINPDEGRIEMYGKIGALIELGAGFNPILTGRENVYNNGAVLGFSKAEIDRKFEDIVAFAEIEDFIDMPVQNYSSGMKVRLGFAIASQMEPDILIIDEVLAVGDIGFVLKCLKKIDELLSKAAVIFVSHNMPQVSRISNRIILLEKGVLNYLGDDVGKGVSSYYDKFSQNTKTEIYNDNSIEEFSIKTNKPEDNFKWSDDIEFRISFKNLTLLRLPYISIGIFDKENRPVGLVAYESKNDLIDKGQVNIKILHKRLQLSRGKYSINVTISESFNYNPIFRINNILNINIESEFESFPPFLLEGLITELIHE